MARDYTKYDVEGVGLNLNKRKLVFSIVADYATKNCPSFDELQSVFPDALQGSGKGMIRNVATDRVDPNRFFPDQIVLADTAARVSNQWGFENIQNFIEHAKALGYAIRESESSDTPSQTNKSIALTANLEIWTDSQEMICKLRRFVIDGSGENEDLIDTYQELIEEFNTGDMAYFAQTIIGRFEREIYRQFIIDSEPSEDEYGWTMEDMKGEEFDWWGVCPHLVVTKVGEIDLSPLAHLDDEDEGMVAKCCEIFGGMDPDELEDAIMDYQTESRYSVDSDLFKEVLEEM